MTLLDRPTYEEALRAAVADAGATPKEAQILHSLILDAALGNLPEEAAAALRIVRKPAPMREVFGAFFERHAAEGSQRIRDLLAEGAPIIDLGSEDFVFATLRDGVHLHTAHHLKAAQVYYLAGQVVVGAETFEEVERVWAAAEEWADALDGGRYGDLIGAAERQH